MMIEQSKYRHQLQQLKIIILDGVSFFIVWQSLNKEYEDSIRNIGKNEGFWWQYRGFFAPARKALLWSALMQLSKAYDKDNRSVNIGKLLKTALENRKELAPHTTRNSLKSILNKIDKNSELIQRLIRYRNQRLAHFDSDLNDNIELPSEEVHTLIEETKSIYNSIKFSYEGEYDNFNDIMEDVYLHTKQVISIINDKEKHG